LKAPTLQDNPMYAFIINQRINSAYYLINITKLKNFNYPAVATDGKPIIQLN
jgi:hypothetical protein